MVSINDFKDSSVSGLRNIEKSIFIWLDILGFGDAVEDEKKYVELSELLNKFQSLFNDEDDYSTNIISDGIILHIPTDKLHKLKDIFKSIGEKQFQFTLENGVFIRGGIAVGSKYENQNINNNVFISNGLARAVKLEAGYVNWAVIGTNKKVISEIQDLITISDKEDNFNLIRGFNKKGEDVFFIDFLSNSQKYVDLLNARIEEFSSKIKNPHDRGSSNIRDKYIWLLRYYHHKYGNTQISQFLKGTIL